VKKRARSAPPDATSTASSSASTTTEGIRDLRGCIADLDQVEDFLKKRFNITDGSEKSSGFGSLVESFGKMFEGKINWEKLPEYTQTYPIEGEDYGALKSCVWKTKMRPTTIS
jgi:hypothetical protein